jgi:hypothetical protein
MVVIEPKKYLKITTSEIGDELNGLKKELEVKKKKAKEGEEEEK